MQNEATTKQLFFGSDHAGYELKQFLMNLFRQEYTVIDVGAMDKSSCDYPVYATKLCDSVLEHEAPGILICGSGIGMSMTANRIKGIRAALCLNEYMAVMSRKHNNANVLCLGERIIGIDLASAIARAFLSARFEGGRHLKRIELIDELVPT
ncbi:ribose 5-phosphate isomerase B [Desulfonatronovibrio magnus]|uniref:ribose 5-phosphate isomerase B n=1 Tax=Desulfonatronovibrio magnus TaxID=698827 RepID=UPI0005EAC914|nr:ribose 5-phosphate isomerase B [Desulfonatronovibrio magnus]RQD66477.1 MAG: ribose 5-phosphate isomerase B [Desulfonatronovibrio sp. MSAO_Bac4]